MKLSTSPSLSSSSTTSIAYQSDVCNTKRPRIIYLAGVLRRMMLCTLSFPTHPSDQIMEKRKNSSDGNDGTDSQAQNHIGDKNSCPGIVARLMGLESLPKKNSMTDHTAAFRRRSVVNYWPDGQIPACVGLEDVEFFVLSFERGIGSREVWSTQRKSKKWKMSKCKTEDDDFETEKVHIRRLRPRPGSAREVLEETCSVNVSNAIKSRRRDEGNGMKDFEAEEAEECSSEDGSPVSVLDFGEWNVDPEEEPTTGSDDSYMRSRRKLPPELKNRGDLISGARGNKHSVSRSSWKPSIHHEMCRIAETKIMESKWASSGTHWQLRLYEDIGVDLGLLVLDQLLDEMVVDQL
ncbi:hypothetical protein SAY86_008910 [Trapa natans]|uniref:DUF3741 domain-containing protein n=1 Tax=Trapa natans TaxID=22666 RepID=A0AAN7QBS9_TRANT|nr:hypothetical protein SAY86_008910 [Trapa natans]